MEIKINKTSLSWVAGIFISIGVIWTGVATGLDKFNEYHNDRWVTVAGLQSLFDSRDLKALKKKIAEYEWIKNEGGGLSQKQKWELEQMYDELEEATE